MRHRRGKTHRRGYGRTQARVLERPNSRETRSVSPQTSSVGATLFTMATGGSRALTSAPSKIPASELVSFALGKSHRIAHRRGPAAEDHDPAPSSMMGRGSERRSSFVRLTQTARWRAKVLRGKLAKHGVHLHIIAPKPGESIDAPCSTRWRDATPTAMATKDYGGRTRRRRFTRCGCGTRSIYRRASADSLRMIPWARSLSTSGAQLFGSNLLASWIKRADAGDVVDEILPKSGARRNRTRESRAAHSRKRVPPVPPAQHTASQYECAPPLVRKDAPVSARRKLLLCDDRPLRFLVQNNAASVGASWQPRPSC